MHWGQIVTELESVLQGGVYDLEEMSLSYGGDDAVRIMNIHQAKGLQAKVVFLADPCGVGYKGGVERHVSRVGEDPYLSIRIMKQTHEFNRSPIAQPVGWDADAEEEALHAEAEEVRLLYVAGTRARNLLVVSLYVPKKEEGRHRWIQPALIDVPELESFAATDASSAGDGAWTPATIGVTDTAPAPILRSRADQIAAARLARIERSTVTGGKEASNAIESASSGKGRDFGTIVHDVFEDAVLGRLPDDPVPYVRTLCTAAELDAEQLSLESLRLMYRLLFVFYIEARPELGYVPIQRSETYLKGYSLESLRDLERGGFRRP